MYEPCLLLLCDTSAGAFTLQLFSRSQVNAVSLKSFPCCEMLDSVPFGYATPGVSTPAVAATACFRASHGVAAISGKQVVVITSIPLLLYLCALRAMSMSRTSGRAERPSHRFSPSCVTFTCNVNNVRQSGTPAASVGAHAVCEGLSQSSKTAAKPARIAPYGFYPMRVLPYW